MARAKKRPANIPDGAIVTYRYANGVSGKGEVVAWDKWLDAWWIRDTHTKRLVQVPGTGGTVTEV